jgi:hypothetical protein
MMRLNDQVLSILTQLPAGSRAATAKDIHSRLPGTFGLNTVTQALVSLENRRRVKRRGAKPTVWHLVEGETT